MRFHEYQFHENCPGSQDAINVLMTSLIRRISRSKNRRGIFQLVVQWMGRESHRDGKTSKSAAGRIRLSRELRIIARREKERKKKVRQREKEKERRVGKRRDSGWRRSSRVGAIQPPPPSPSHRHTDTMKRRHQHRRRSTCVYVYLECVRLCHRLDSTALRDDGTTGEAIGVEKFNCAYFRSDVSQILRPSPRVPYTHPLLFLQHSPSCLLVSRKSPSSSLSCIFHSLPARTKYYIYYIYIFPFPFFFFFFYLSSCILNYRRVSSNLKYFVSMCTPNIRDLVLLTFFFYFPYALIPLNFLFFFLSITLALVIFHPRSLLKREMLCLFHCPPFPPPLPFPSVTRPASIFIVITNLIKFRASTSRTRGCVKHFN
ncbi:hypothetical protein PUN28_003834 [Cardiocondyla obscurior]|uniref:Uncharacterized protein n=1 Tax=Cardiocondyla obscurior TaxID=286306 RepID=A0AAW2GNN4_9HYME